MDKELAGVLLVRCTVDKFLPLLHAPAGHQTCWAQSQAQAQAQAHHEQQRKLQADQVPSSARDEQVPRRVTPDCAQQVSPHRPAADTCHGPAARVGTSIAGWTVRRGDFRRRDVCRVQHNIERRGYGRGFVTAQTARLQRVERALMPPALHTPPAQAPMFTLDGGHPASGLPTLGRPAFSLAATLSPTPPLPLLLTCAVGREKATPKKSAKFLPNFGKIAKCLPNFARKKINPLSDAEIDPPVTGRHV